MKRDQKCNFTRCFWHSHKVGKHVDENNKLGQFNVFRKINKGSLHVQGKAERSGKCQVLGMQDYTRQNSKNYLLKKNKLKTTGLSREF